MGSTVSSRRLQLIIKALARGASRGRCLSKEVSLLVIVWAGEKLPGLPPRPPAALPPPGEQVVGHHRPQS